MGHGNGLNIRKLCMEKLLVGKGTKCHVCFFGENFVGKIGTSNCSNRPFPLLFSPRISPLPSLSHWQKCTSPQDENFHHPRFSLTGTYIILKRKLLPEIIDYHFHFFPLSSTNKPKQLICNYLGTLT